MAVGGDRMRTKVSKTMAKTLNQELKNREFTNIDSFIYDDEIGMSMYSQFIDYDTFDHENDWDIETSRFKAIRVNYKPDCYACDRYITTNDLIDAARAADCDYTAFMNEIFNRYEC